MTHSMQLAADTSANRLAKAFPGSLRATGAEQQVSPYVYIAVVFVFLLVVVATAAAVDVVSVINAIAFIADIHDDITINAHASGSQNAQRAGCIPTSATRSGVLRCQSYSSGGQQDNRQSR